ncbi:MAG: glutamate-1-semialdehyde 2,1-aminomutase [Flavobacteriales bacterium AspAUS03]
MTRYQRSSALFQEAQQYIPGGVNSPVRSFKNIGGVPLFIKEACGAYLFDEDGHRYIDYINSWGPMIMGHAYPPVVRALTEQIQKGTSYGAPTTLETQMASLIIDIVPGVDKVRMVNSGTEACMSAVRLARGYTGQEKIIKFAGCYHGHADAFLIMAGSGAATFDIPNSPGVTQGAVKDTLLARYNDLESIQKLIGKHRGTIAAIIIEPVAGNMGCIPPKENFLKGLRNFCSTENILLIFDEVMTGFRLARGGAQEYFGIQADIVTFGKIIGGGLPVGAFAARQEIMAQLAPDGPVYQSGTLSGNPLAMCAGYELLKTLNDQPAIFKSLHNKTEYLHRELSRVLSTASIPHSINRCGSMLSLSFTTEAVKDFETAQGADNAHFKKFFHGMLKQGVYLPPSPFETWFVCDALTAEDIDHTIMAAAAVCKEAFS